MLNRRHLRIKALQNLYAYYQNDGNNLAVFEKKLLNQVDTVYKNYLQLLLLIIEVALHTEVDARERTERHIKDVTNLNPSIRLLHNRFVKQLLQNTSLTAQLKKHQLTWQGESDLIRQLFLELRKKKEYEEYCAAADTYENDSEYIEYMVKKVIAKSVAINQYFEELNLSWNSDKEVVYSMVSKTLKQFTEKSDATQALASIAPNWEDDSAFYLQLFRNTVLHSDEYEAYIGNKTKNWDVERIAMMDILLMKMAICELLSFPSIPVKATINEYIDISKEYSTPNSKTFINGVLDKVLIELKEQGKIKKTGRGLIE